VQNAGSSRAGLTLARAWLACHDPNPGLGASTSRPDAAS
jgi:hypothetical protein